MQITPSERESNVAEMCEFMRLKKLTPDDLIWIGGEDLRSPDPQRAGKARCVEKCWSLMARLGVKHVDLPEMAGQSTDHLAPRRRHRKSNLKHQQNQRVDVKEAPSTKSSKINDLAVSAAVGDPELNLGDIERAGPVANATGAP
jgi:hypothetical protein